MLYNAFSLATAEFADSLMYGNFAHDEGGAIYNETGAVSMINCTVADNKRAAGSIGAGIRNYAGSFEVRNSILWWNRLEGEETAAYISAADQFLGEGTITHSCIKDNDAESVPFGGAANGNIDQDPLFVGPPAPGRFHYVLQETSPAVDAGRTVLASDLDLERNTRVVRCRVDMGAYEYQVEADESGACCAGAVCFEVANPCACQTGYVCDVNALNDGTAPNGACGNSTGGCCYGDADGNGTVNAGDRGFISAAIGTSDPNLICLNDLDGNGVVNAGDKGFVTANIGLCTPLPDWQNGSGNNSSLNEGEYDPRFPGEFTLAGDCETTVCEE